MTGGSKITANDFIPAIYSTKKNRPPGIKTLFRNMLHGNANYKYNCANEIP